MLQDMKSRIIYLGVFLITLLASCSDNSSDSNYDPSDDEIPGGDSISDQIRAIIVNEGHFGYGTASLTSVSTLGEVNHDLFRKVNDRPMGDVAQSLTQIGDLYYVPLNNSRKIEVFDSKTYESIETMSIDRDVIPMYIQHLGGDSIALTDQRAGQLMIVDINHGTERPIVRRSIQLGHRSFQMYLKNNKLFVGGDQLLVFDLTSLTNEGMRTVKNSSGEILRTIDFSKIVEDKNGKLWVITPTMVYSIDPETERTVDEINLSHIGLNDWVSCIDISPDKGTLYVNSARRVYTIDADKPKKPTEPIISPTRDDGRTVYNMSISKENTVFFCEVLYGSISRARIYEYNPKSGEQIQLFKAGVFPHFIHFR